MAKASDLLMQAAQIVDGNRNVTHGEKERSFCVIADLWSIYLEARGVICKDGGESLDVSAEDVAWMMVLMKIARRLCGTIVADHAIDAAGYAGIAGELGLPKAEG